MSRPRVAIAHDYLTQRGGAERVVLALLQRVPRRGRCTPCCTTPTRRSRSSATSAWSPRRSTGSVRCARTTGWRCRCSPRPSSRMVVDADVTVVSTSGWAHGFDVRGRSVVYCHNPARWLYQGAEYLGEQPRRLAAARPGRAGAAPAPLGPRRDAAATTPTWSTPLWSGSGCARRTASTPTSSSRPPWCRSDGVQEPVGPFEPGFHLLVSRLLPYKNVDRAIEAFRVAARRAAAGDRPRAGGGAAARPAAAERRDRLRRQRRPAALGLRALRRADRARHRGLRADPPRGGGVRQADPGAAGRRLPRHGGRRRQRALLRPARGRRHRRGRAPEPGAPSWDAAAIRQPRPRIRRVALPVADHRWPPIAWSQSDSRYLRTAAASARA